jgi:hypothetical protein
MSLGKVSIAIEAAMASFESDMGRAARLMEKETRKMERDAKRLEGEMKRVGKIVGTALVAGLTAAAYAIKGVINDMDEMSKSAQRANMPTEEFSRLAYAGSLADVSMQDLEKSMGKLAKAQGDAAQGLQTQVRGFDALGISFQNADGSLRSTIDVFLDFADVFQKNQGSPEIMALGMQVFGRSFQNLIPLLKDGRAGLQGMFDESDRLGKTLSGDAGRAAEHFNDNLTRLNARFSALKQEVAQQVLPTLINLTEEFIGAATDGDTLEATARRIGAAFNSAVSGILNFHDRLVILRNTMAQFELSAQQFSPMAGIRSLADGGSYMAPYEEMVKRQQELAGEAEAARARIEGRNSRWAGVSGSASGSWEKPKPNPDPVTITAPTKAGNSGPSEAEREAERLLKLYERETASLQRQAEMIGKTGEAARVAYEIKAGELAKLEPAQQAELMRLAEIADAERKRHETQEAGKQLIESLMTPTERVNEQLAEAARLLEAGAIAQADYNRAIEAYQTPAQQMIADMQFERDLLLMNNLDREKAIALRYAGADATEAERQAIVKLVEEMEHLREMDQFRAEFQRSMADAFYDFATGAKSAEDAAKSFFDNMAKMILRMISERWAQNIADMFMGAKGGGSAGGGTNWFATLFSSFFGGGREHGGAVYRDRLYEVGEGGKPEILSARGKTYLIPGNDGEVTPMKAGGAGVTQVNHFHYRAPYDPRTEAQKNARLEFETRRALARTTA